jgi:uncharacterized membrane-anchored protein YhcB (DUF1043 family)
MENITIGQITGLCVGIASFLGAVVQLIKYTKKLLKTALKEEFEPIKNELDTLNKKIVENTLSQNKNFLTMCFDDLDSGKIISETTKERIYECMEEYTKNGGNSYIHTRYEKLVKENKL